MGKKHSDIAMIFLAGAFILLPTLDPTDILTIPIYEQFGAVNVIAVGVGLLILYYVFK